MSISDLRTEFKSLSGLISATDAECDKWINRGIRHLDLTSNFLFSEGRQAQLITAGQYQVDFLSTCRVLESAWVVNLDTVTGPITGITQTAGRTRIKLFTKHETFKEVYPDLPNATQGTPEGGVIAVIRGVDSNSVPGTLTDYDSYVETKVLSASNIADGSLSADGSVLADYKITGNVRGLIFAPPADHEYMLEIYGKFFSVILTDDIPDNQWSIQYPDTVLAAALYKLNLIKYRNTEGAKDYMNEISATLGMLDFDRAEEEMSNVTRMEG